MRIKMQGFSNQQVHPLKSSYSRLFRFSGLSRFFSFFGLFGFFGLSSFFSLFG